MAEERQDTSPLDSTANAAMQTAKTAKQAKQIADGVKSAKNAAKGTQAASSIATASGGSVAGSTIGTAVAGPLGTVIGFLVTNKTFQRIVAGVMAGILMFLFVIVNFIGILFSYLGFMDANSFVNEAQSKELSAIRSRIEQILEVEEYQTELLSIISQEHGKKLQEIQADYEANYKEHKLTIIDEYETRLKENLPYYIGILLMQKWDSTTQKSFLGYSGGFDADLDTDLSSPYDAFFEEAANTYNVPVALLIAMGKVESNFDPNVESSAGAIGIMQLMPGTAASLGVTNPYDPKQNIMGGAKYVAELIGMFQGHANALELVIAGYNAGPQAVINAGYQIPPYAETQNHVKKVMGYIQILEQPGGTGNSSDAEESPEELEKAYQLLKNAVTEYAPQFFSWSVTNTTEQSSVKTIYYIVTEVGRTEITKETYLALTESGQNVQMEEQDVQESTVEYTLALLLNSQLSQNGSRYEYKYILDQGTFEIVLRVLQIMQDGIDALKKAIFSLFSWTDFVTGGGIDDSITGNIDVTGDKIRYDTVEDCVKEVTYFNQTEEPWASLPYGTSNVGAAGCGPTSLAIVISTFTGQNVTPEITKTFAEQNGEYVPNVGTSHSFVKNAATHWGLTCERVGKDRMDYVVESLKDGKLVVEICEAYTITGGSSGHFIVLTGVTADGYITIADCASRERTGKLYSVETIKSYGRDLSEGAFWIIGK